MNRGLPLVRHSGSYLPLAFPGHLLVVADQDHLTAQIDLLLLLFSVRFFAGGFNMRDIGVRHNQRPDPGRRFRPQERAVRPRVGHGLGRRRLFAVGRARGHEVDGCDRVGLAPTVGVLDGYITGVHRVARDVQPLSARKHNDDRVCFHGHDQRSKEHHKSLHLAPPKLVTTMIVLRGGIGHGYPPHETRSEVLQPAQTKQRRPSSEPPGRPNQAIRSLEDQ